MSAVVWLVPTWWPALCLLPVLLWLGARWSAASRRRQTALLGARADELCGPATGGWVRAGSAVAAAGLAALALLQPVGGGADDEPVGPDLVLCLDVSRSMAARDTVPTRLAAAQRQIAELAGTVVAGRLSLVAFAGDAHLVVPLTADAASVAVVADTLVAGASGRGGSDLGAAIDVGLLCLQRVQSRVGGIVVLTDGEDFGGRGAGAAARARGLGVAVHCLGFGSEGGSKIVVEGTGGEAFLVDAAGDEVVTRCDRQSLSAVAAAGGGHFAAAGSGFSLRQLYTNELLPAAEARAVADPHGRPAHRYQWPLLLALLAWMLHVCWPERRR